MLVQAVQEVGSLNATKNRVVPRLHRCRPHSVIHKGNFAEIHALVESTDVKLSVFLDLPVLYVYLTIAVRDYENVVGFLILADQILFRPAKYYSDVLDHVAAEFLVRLEVQVQIDGSLENVPNDFLLQLRRKSLKKEAKLLLKIGVA